MSKKRCREDRGCVRPNRRLSASRGRHSVRRLHVERLEDRRLLTGVSELADFVPYNDYQVSEGGDTLAAIVTASENPAIDDVGVFQYENWWRDINGNTQWKPLKK